MVEKMRLKRLLMRKKLLLIALLVLNRSETKPKRQRRWWVHPLWRPRKKFGHFGNLLKAMRIYDVAYFKNFTRMSPERFDLLQTLVHRKLQTRCFGRKDVISPGECLALTLRFLATGDGLRSMSYGFRMGMTTVQKVIQKTCRAIWYALQPLYMPMPTQKTWEQAAIGYWQKWNYPNTCGAVDGKHVMIVQPSKSGSLYYNYKGFNSTVLMAVVDGDYKFLTVDVGAYGSTSDGGTFKSSEFGQAFQKGEVKFPPPRTLPDSELQTPHVLLGDDAFQMTPSFMKPYANKNLTTMQRIFNYRLSRARRCSENAFGILAARWRIFRHCIHMQPKNVDWVVKATVALHNFLIEEEAKSGTKIYCPIGYADSLDSLGNIIPGQWHTDLINNPANGLRNATPTLARNYSHEANDVRNAFAQYFISEDGEVPWQWQIPGVVNPRSY